MVGHIPLEDGIGVRVPDPQPTRASSKIASFQTKRPFKLRGLLLFYTTTRYAIIFL
jgi:hypothetical protein